MYMYIYIVEARAIKTPREHRFSTIFLHSVTRGCKSKMALGYCTVTLHFTVVAIFSHHHHGIPHSFDAGFPSKVDENREIDRLMMEKERKKGRERERASERANERAGERERANERERERESVCEVKERNGILAPPNERSSQFQIRVFECSKVHRHRVHRRQFLAQRPIVR